MGVVRVITTALPGDLPGVGARRRDTVLVCLAPHLSPWQREDVLLELLEVRERCWPRVVEPVTRR